MTITADELRRTVTYDPDTGIFCWTNSPRRGVPAGSVITTKNSNGYLRFTINKRHYYGHRLAWLYIHGRWPAHEIDHVNCDPLDNRICNLREATSLQNKANCRRPRHNTSGFKGVSFDKRDGRYYAYITIFNRKKHLGIFDTPEEAHAAHMRAAESRYGEFARAA